MAPFVRKNIWTLENQGPNPFDPVTLAYAQAVATMQGRSVGDPTSWQYQANMHFTHTRPAQPAWNGCQHGTWWFLPWHRMYIYWFERIVRAAVVASGGPADWALPYWNYSDVPEQHALPRGFAATTLPNGQTNPLYVDNTHRKAGINSGARISQPEVDYRAAFARTDFGLDGGTSGFTNLLEQQPHGNIHTAVGRAPARDTCNLGWMSTVPCAAQDPIFYLHHSNIDRLWVSWLALGAGRANPADSGWLNKRYQFFDEHGAAVYMSPRDVLDNVAQLDYVYDDQLQGAVSRFAPLPPTSGVVAGHPSRGQEEVIVSTIGETSQQLALHGDVATAKVPLATEAQEEVASIAAATPAPLAKRVFLHVEDIHGEKLPGQNYGVYLNVPGENPADYPDHLVGVVNFFGATHPHEPGHEGHGSHERHGGLRLTYDITDNVRQLQTDGLWNPKEATVQFAPLELEAPEGKTLPAAPGEPDTEALIGKVRFSTE